VVNSAGKGAYGRVVLCGNVSGVVGRKGWSCVVCASICLKLVGFSNASWNFRGRDVGWGVDGEWLVSERLGHFGCSPSTFASSILHPVQLQFFLVRVKGKCCRSG
jgi:hypothetical protein